MSPSTAAATLRSHIADGMAVGAALALPWSTSATCIFLFLLALAILSTLRIREVMDAVATGTAAVAVALFGIAALGMAWSDTTWFESFGALSAFSKLLVIPLLFAYSRRSDCAIAVLVAYAASVAILLLVSWVFLASAADHSTATETAIATGVAFAVPVKNPATQLREFLVCGFALLLASDMTLRVQQTRLALGLAAAAIVFIATALYLASFTQTIETLVTMLVLGIAVFIRSGRMTAALAALLMIATVAWTFSPAVSKRIGLEWYNLSPQQGAPENWRGGRGDFWQQSIKFIGQAPLLGHGLGSIPRLFEQAASSRGDGLSNTTIDPHQQTLAIGIQLGLLGMATLWLMWLTHLAHFWRKAGIGSLGIIVVLQNIVGSFFDSLIFEFTMGWFYVLTVGLIAGMAGQWPAIPTKPEKQ